MHVDKSSAQESLVISRKELESMLIGYARNEMRAVDLLEKASKNDAPTQEKTMLEYQRIKARGFKEAIDCMLYSFTGKMVNIDDKCNLLGGGK